MHIHEGVATVKVGHASMQYSDTKSQVQHDAAIIFHRGYDWLTGTEAGEDPVQSVLREQAKAHNYTFHVYKSNWVAIHRPMIHSGYDTWGDTVVDNDLVVGPGHDLNISGSVFQNEWLGVVTVMSSHYATKGDPHASDPARRVNVEVNKKLAHAIGDRATKAGAGKALAFLGADTNIQDRYSDVFFSKDLTTTWDELSVWPSTGHGCIDVIATYDRDTRVTAKSSRAFTDKQLMLYMDHFLIEANIEIRTLKAA